MQGLATHRNEAFALGALAAGAILSLAGVYEPVALGLPLLVYGLYGLAMILRYARRLTHAEIAVQKLKLSMGDPVAAKLRRVLEGDSQ